MIRAIKYFITGCIFSCFLFPVYFMFMKSLNTKMILAALGVLLFFYEQFTKKKGFEVSKGLFSVTCGAFAVSVVSFIAVALNDTNDYVYVSYVVSMLVWLCAAYFAVMCIKRVHGYVNVELVGRYLVFVCLGQCICALINQFVLPFRVIVDAIVWQGQDMLKAIGRMYGIGANLDVAGSRFACALIVLSSMISNETNKVNYDKGSLFFYIGCFLFMSVVGCMIARTTTVGIILGIVVFFLSSDFVKFRLSNSLFFLIVSFGLVVSITIPILQSLYHSSAEFRELFEFGFEAFFNSSSDGELHTTSTDMLMEMWTKIPDSLHTWVIGDGYFTNPNFIDPYYVGDETKEFLFYKGTDVGYLRFIYYFGLIGLSVFITFFTICTKVCSGRNSEYKLIFIFFFLMNMILWVKVSTDIFVIFAAFLAIGDNQGSLLETEDK